MKNWENFEIESVKFLNERFGDCATFIHQGKSDSTVVDIKVITKSDKQFYIEAKQSPAHCGQFVLLPNVEKRMFEYSMSNQTSINKFSKIIMDYMNNNFENFKEAGTSGKDIIFDGCQKVFIDWIIQTYKEKGVEYIITNDNIILSIEQFSQFFEVTAKYRIKRSGSTSVGKSNLQGVKNFLNNNFNDIEIDMTKDKLFVNSNKDLHNKRFMFGKNEYMISKRDTKYEVRKLSNTFNANVIFSIKLKTNNGGIDYNKFKFILLNKN